jgi:hypothetical protein
VRNQGTEKGVKQSRLYSLQSKKVKSSLKLKRMLLNLLERCVSVDEQWIKVDVN